MAVSVAEFNAIKADVQCHEEFINGNGKIGAKERLHAIEIKLTALLWIVGIFGSVATGMIVYFMTRVMPMIFAHVGAP
jgi:hypothetical protein